MKRGYEDDLYQGPLKRPVSDRHVATSAFAGQKLTTGDALGYLRQVKHQFATNKQIYDTFLEIMKEFKAQRIDTPGVIARVKDLFHGHPELILGFNTFLPKGFEIKPEEVEPKVEPAPRQPIEFDQAISYVNKIKIRFQDQERVYKSFLEILNLYRKGQKTIDSVYAEVARLFYNHDDLLEEFTYFLPNNNNNGAAPQMDLRNYQHARPEAYPALQGHTEMVHHVEEVEMSEERQSLTAELVFFESVKSRLRSRESYQEFLKVLALYAKEIISKQELQHLMSDIIGRFPDLMEGFNKFLHKCEGLEFDLDANAVRHDLFAHDQAHRKDTAKYNSEPVSACIDLQNCERIQKSYVRIPDDYPQLHCMGRDTLPPVLRDLFNDHWVSVTSGSEDYSFSQFRRNVYEENLFRSEDDRFELDMDICTNESTIKAIKELADSMEKMSVQEKEKFQIPEGYFKAFQRRNIIKIWDAEGAHVFDTLCKHPAAALPRILSRLEQKDAEWRKTKGNMEVMWQKIAEQNYPRSLDHRSFYFKQADKKQLGHKVMVAEVKEIAEKRLDDEAKLKLMSAATPFSGRLKADFTFDQSDMEVHDDVLRVLCWAAKKHCTGDAPASVKRFMVDVVEPLFGRPRHSIADCDAIEQEGPSNGRTPPSTPLSHKGREPEECVSPDTDDACSDVQQTTPGVSGSDDECSNKRVDRSGKSSGIEGDDGYMADADMEQENRAPSSADSDTRCLAAARPLCCDAGGDGETSSSAPSDGGLHVLYGNEQLYIFFRLHQHLFERLGVARRCARLNTRGFRNPQADEMTAEQKQEYFETKHGKFMELIWRLFAQKLDMTTFEDSCRELLGMNAYVLFTIDKLVTRLMKHLQHMLQDKQTHELIKLYNYERTRSCPAAEHVYYVNTQVMMQDDTTYRFAYESGQPGKFVIQLMDKFLDDFPVPAMESQYEHFLKSYAEGVSVEESEVGRNLLLHRCAHLVQPDSAEMHYLDGIVQVNGLEINAAMLGAEDVGARTGKRSHIPHTEDVMYRCPWREPNELKAESDRQRRLQRFTAWTRNFPIPPPSLPQRRYDDDY